MVLVNLINGKDKFVKIINVLPKQELVRVYQWCHAYLGLIEYLHLKDYITTRA